VSFECLATFQADGIKVESTDPNLDGLLEALWELLYEDDRLVGTAVGAVRLPSAGLVVFDYPTDLDPKSVDIHRQLVLKQAESLLISDGQVSDWVDETEVDDARLQADHLHIWDILPWPTPLGRAGRRLPGEWASTLLDELLTWTNQPVQVSLGVESLEHVNPADWKGATRFNLAHGHVFMFSDSTGSWSLTSGSLLHRIRVAVPEDDWDDRWAERLRGLITRLVPSPALAIESSGLGDIDTISAWLFEDGPLNPISLSTPPAAVRTIVARSNIGPLGPDFEPSPSWNDAFAVFTRVSHF
jgi:hypothetical protein